VASGPLVLRGVSGETISGLHVSNPSGPCVLIENSTDIRLEGMKFGPCGGEAVKVMSSSDVTVTDSLVSGTTRAIYGWNVKGFTVSNVSVADSGSGVVAVDSSQVVVEFSTFTNAGRNFVQFDKVNGAGNRVVGNVGENVIGGSNAEDFISIYKSSGTSSDPLLVSGNRLRNGGPSKSGSGIMVGDAGGSHIVVSDNILVNPGQVGIGVASGTNVRILNNRVYSDSFAWSNVGIYVWNQYSTACSSIEVSGNQVRWLNASGNSNGGWNNGNCGTVAGWSNNDWQADLTPSGMW
jgi:hypothetical protein